VKLLVVLRVGPGHTLFALVHSLPHLLLFLLFPFTVRRNARIAAAMLALQALY